jgi:hypothetical protein
MKAEKPEIAKIVRYWMPNDSEEELKEATVNFREYLGVIYRIFLQLEREGRLNEIRSGCDCGCDECIKKGYVHPAKRLSLVMRHLLVPCHVLTQTNSLMIY